jgi:hypothetical protein
MNLTVAPITHEAFFANSLLHREQPEQIDANDLLRALVCFSNVASGPLFRLPNVDFSRDILGPTGEMILGPGRIWLGTVRSATLVSVSKS